MANINRPKQIIFRMSEEELQLLNSKIAAANMTKQEYLVRAALGAPLVDKEIIKSILTSIRKLGNNLNQITRKLNAGFDIDLEELIKLIKEIETEWQSLKLEILNQE